ncbi:MAG TPA: glycoside hydrolase family 15 protein [Polyangiaceae bacterium]|nr:glycoside hydrolase family 15 protein [Polyangiaceae bacterium]
MQCQRGVPSRIEDYALIGDCQTAALVSRSGSIDWLCLPRFDSGACFAALLGGPEHGRWTLAPKGRVHRVTRAYREGTLVLDTTFECDGGVVVLTDFMPLRERVPHLVRIVRCTRGRVRIATQLVVRFDYGSIVPWVRRQGEEVLAIAGPDSLRIQSEMPLRGAHLTTVGEMDLPQGLEVALSATWHPSHVKSPERIDERAMLRRAERDWRDWSSRCTYDGPWRDQVLRSLVTLKALTHAPTGGIVAAPTTSLPECLGGVRNWDYRFTWVRDAAFTLIALIENGYTEEALAWRDWLLRAVAGDPAKMQILYGVDGFRRVEEQKIEWLPGYEGARPVRIGNAAHTQRQLDVYGEIMDAMHQARLRGFPPDPKAWDMACALLDHLEACWADADDGIWEMRGPRRQFTHSKMMTWVAFDRAVKRVQAIGGAGDVERWKAVRDRIHDEVCRLGFDASVGAFVQYYGSKELDASLLMMPLVGFLPVTDPRVQSTVAAIQRDLVTDGGLVLRYRTDREVDGLPEGEGVFLPCSFWLADDLALLGRHDEACRLFERLLGLCNDVGLVSEEYDPHARRLVGNFPQAFTHVSLVNCARQLAEPGRHKRAVSSRTLPAHA